MSANFFSRIADIFFRCEFVRVHEKIVGRLR